MEAVVFYSLLIYLICILLVVVYNLLSRPVLEKRSLRLTETPRVSLLIPARNEAAVIEKSLKAAVSQDYENYEIIVLDDQSEDQTGAIARSFESKGTGVTVLQGEDLPEGWIGKNWACHQLSKKVWGDILIFLDADCFLQPWAIESIVGLMKEKDVALLSCFPTQEMISFGERLVVPSMNWLLLSFLPLRLVYHTPHKAVVAANGQMMAFDKSAYDKAGGHEKVKHEIVEDMELARTFKSSGYKILTLLGSNTISCRMYDSFMESFRGFSKNFFPGFKTTPVAFSILLLFIAYGFILPYVLIFYNPFYAIHVGLIIAQRIGISVSVKEGILANAFLHPFQMVIMILVGINSMRINIAHKVRWKGRTI